MLLRLGWLLCALLACNCWALQFAYAADIDVDSVRFRNYAIREGISQATIRAIAQDDQGFLWFGTQDGLNRFDGYEFRSYFRDSEPKDALSDNHILALLADPLRRGLWVGTQSRGLNFLDLGQDRFRTFRAGENGLESDQIVDLALGRDGHVWLITNRGLQRYNSATERFSTLSGSFPLSALALSSDGSVYVGGPSGLYKVSEDSLQHWPDAAASQHNVSALTTDPHGTLWVGLSDSGLIHLRADGTLVAVYGAKPEQMKGLPSAEIRSLLLTSAEELWVGTMDGLALLNAEQDHFMSWKSDQSYNGSLPANRIPRLFEDRQGLIWAGTWTGGVAVHNPQTRAIVVARHQRGDPTSLPANPVRAIWRDLDGSVWLGVLEGGGLVHYDFERGVLARYIHDPSDPRSLGNNVVQAIRRTRNGELLVATSGGGLNRLDPDMRGFTRYGKVPNAVGQLDTATVLSVFEDRDNTLWVGSGDAGLFERCATCQNFTRFSTADGNFTPVSINAIYQPRDGTLWIGAQAEGLAVIDLSTRTMRRFRANEADPQALSHDTVTSIVETARGDIWLGTQGGGVNRVLQDGVSLRFRSVRKRNGLSADAIGAIQEDTQGWMWISTTSGVSAYQPDRNLLRNLSANEGLDRVGYFIASAARDPAGRLMFGGLNGLIRFNPLDLAKVERAGAVAVTDIRLFNVPLKLAWQDPRSPLKASSARVRQVTFNHLQSMWSMRFSGLEFATPESVRFSYRLVGLNDLWVDAGVSQHSASFTNTPPGRYEFQVRASNDLGASWGPTTRIAVRVLPASWRSPWALAAYLLAAIITALLIWLRLRRSLHERNLSNERIRSSQEQLKHALWGSRDELWDVDFRTGELQSINPIEHLERRGGLQIRNAEDLLERAHPDDRALLRLALHAHIEEGTEYYEAAFRMRTVDDDWAWVLSRGRAVERDAQGKALRMVGTARDISDVKAVEDELRSVNERLEERVEQRTAALLNSNQDLSATLDALKVTQTQLVEAEKMASLGNLVAGVAHEINTPLGIGVTAASHLHDETSAIQKKIERGQLSKTELSLYSKVAMESTSLVLKNLERASQLVRSFKQVAVDQSSEQRRTIDLKTYLEEILFALKPKLKRTQHSVRLEVADDLSLSTYPGAISQLIVNLVTNSLTHGFAADQQGCMEIAARVVDADVELRFSDNGMGMPEAVRLRVFEPFFTTKRGQGGSGLGLHIVYNLVTQLLHGRIECQSSPGQGVTFILRFPRRLLSDPGNLAVPGG